MPDRPEDRLTHSEDHYTERKPDNVNRRQIRKTLVAFANSVPDDRTGVLFIGITDNGAVQGVSSPDSTLKTVGEVADQECYPAVEIRASAFKVHGKTVVAVEVLPSKKKPHFSGPAYIRSGSKSVQATQDALEELIASRLSVPREILRWKGKQVTVIAKRKRLGDIQYLGDNRYLEKHTCEVLECTAHWLKLGITIARTGSRTNLSEPLSNISLSTDETKGGRLMIIVEPK